MAKTQDNSRVIGKLDCNRKYSPVSKFPRRLKSHDRPVLKDRSCDDTTPANDFITGS